MKFETLVNEEVYDSSKESDIQIVFVPGIGGRKTWRHQIKYFSNRYRTICIDSSERNFEKTLSSVRRVLGSKNLSNAVLVGSDTSNKIVQKLSDHNKVISTVMTNFAFSTPKPSHNKYRAVKLACRKPKLLKKLFLAEKTYYRIARELSDELDIMSYSDFETYRDVKKQTDIENGLVIQSKNCRFCSMKDAKELRPDITVREVGGGSFCFYEKPEDFNKALSEFTERLEDFIQSKQIREKREKNRTLEDFGDTESFQERMEIRK